MIHLGAGLLDLDLLGDGLGGGLLNLDLLDDGLLHDGLAILVQLDLLREGVGEHQVKRRL